MNGDDHRDYAAMWPEAARVYTSDDGQGFERGSLRGLTTENLHGASEPATGENHSSGQHGSSDHTLVYNTMRQPCQDLTRYGSWDEIHTSTPNQKSKRRHGMHLKNLSTPSINQHITDYASSCLSFNQVPTPADCGADLCVRPTRTSFPDIPISSTIESSSKIYPPEALITTSDRHILTRSPSTYLGLATLGRGDGKVFAARLKDNLDDKIYTVKIISKGSLVQRGVAEVTPGQGLKILRFITDASLSNKPFPFLQKLKENFEDKENLFVVLEYFPTTLANTETAMPFRLSQKTAPPGLLPSSLKTYPSEQEAVQALRLLAAELTLGLLFLHRHGIVHQDIKPANVMISEGGHAVIGEFGAASALPISSQSGGDPFKRCPPSCVDTDGAIYGCIVLQPEDTVTFTPLYAAPELLERKANGLLIYDERADWWSLGVSLYELATGGIPFHNSSDAGSIGKGRRSDGENGLFFDLLEGLDLTGSAARRCDAHLDGYLRSLLVYDASQRLSGERVKSHPFLEPLQDIWAEVEDLRHPPCSKLSAQVRDIDLLFDPQEESSEFDAQRTQILRSRRLLESPQSPLYEEYYTPREAFPSQEHNSLESPPFLTRRMEALAVKRPAGGQVLWNDMSTINSNRVQQSGSSVILQQEAFMSYYIESSFQTNRSFPVGNPGPLSSTTSVKRFFLEENSYGTCSILRRVPEEIFEEDIVRAETSFTDSGLDFPLGPSPESWGHRKSDPFRKPLALQPIYGQRFHELAKDRGKRVNDENLGKPKIADLPKVDWTFDEKITISLLQAGLREQERLEPTVTSRMSKPQSVVAASERIIKAAGRRVVDALRWR